MLEAALGLFASYPVDEVTVGDIAGAADMTSAAVYYHFASKEQILVEGLRRFANELIEQTQVQAAAAQGEDGPRQLVSGLLGWIQQQGAAATVYFVSSVGLNLHVEALRRETRIEMTSLISPVVKAARKKVGFAEAAVVATALVSLVETSAAARLNEDVAFVGLGARRFAAEVQLIADRIVGLEPLSS